MLTSYLDRLRTGTWSAVFIFLGISIITLTILTVLLKKSNPNHVTIGAALVMLLYLTVGAFLVLASCVFIAPEGTTRR